MCAGYHAGLKPTYEGWKPPAHEEISNNGFCLKPTYEGWKQGRHHVRFPIDDGLKPTYEGWKQRKFVNVYFKT